MKISCNFSLFLLLTDKSVNYRNKKIICNKIQLPLAHQRENLCCKIFP